MKSRKWIAIVMTVMLMLMTMTLAFAQTGGIQIKDPALELFIRREIGKSTGLILPSDVETLRTIDTTT